MGPYDRSGGRLPGDPVPDPGVGDTPRPRPAGTGKRGVSSVRTFVKTPPALLVVAGVLYDYLTAAEFAAAPFFTAAPLVAAPLYTLLSTALAGLPAVAAGTLVTLDGAPSALPLGMGELDGRPDGRWARSSRTARRCSSTPTVCPRRATDAGTSTTRRRVSPDAYSPVPTPC